jgi:4-hydroxybenzoate polyprenyltransferase
MKQIRLRRLPARIQGFVRLCHPLPVFFHILAVALLALLAALPHVVWPLWSLVVLAHTAMQMAIAVFNDYCDRDLDTASHRDKPIPLGLVMPRESLLLGIALSLLMIALLLFINPVALGISLLYFILGMSYNLGLKSTPLSGLLFALAFPLIPVYAFVGMGKLVPIVLWLVPVLALLGVALNLANSLPDFEEDEKQQAHTLAVVLGLDRAFWLSTGLIATAALLIGILSFTHLLSINLWLIALILLLTLLCCGCIVVFFGPSMPISKRKQYFYIVVLTCFVLISGWLIGTFT